MSSNNQTQSPNNNIPVNPYDNGALIKKLFNVTTELGIHGVVFQESCSLLEDRVEDMFNNLGIKELDRILIYPEREQRSGDLVCIRCYAYFDTAMQGAVNITKTGGGNRVNGSGSGKLSVFNLVPGYTARGKFETNDLFKTTFFPIAADQSGDELKVQETRDPNIAVLELDFSYVMALCLNIGDNDPFNFTIIDVISNNKRRNGSYEDASIVIMKYIDHSRMTRRKKNKGGRNTNWRALEQDTIDAINRKRR